MPIDRKRALTQAEQDAADFLKLRPQEIEAGLAETEGTIGKSRGKFGQTIADVSRETAGRYGIVPGSLGAPTVGRIGEELDVANLNAQSLRRLRETQDTVNKTANFLYSRLIQSGVDEKQARLTAIQYALDEQRRSAESAAAQRGREVYGEKQVILQDIQRRQLEQARAFAENRRKQAILNSMIKTFAGLAGTFGTAYALKGVGTAAKIGASAAAGTAASSASDVIPDFIPIG